MVLGSLSVFKAIHVTGHPGVRTQASSILKPAWPQKQWNVCMGLCSLLRACCRTQAGIIVYVMLFSAMQGTYCFVEFAFCILLVVLVVVHVLVLGGVKHGT